MARNVVIAVAVMLGLIWAAGASAEMKEGLWEITTKTEMKGMPNQMPAMTMKQCMTKKDMAPKPMSKGEQNCKMKDQKVVGDTVTYVMECREKDGSVMESTGKMTYKGDSFDGTNNVTMKGKQGPPMQMTSRMSGKYLGPCTK